MKGSLLWVGRRSSLRRDPRKPFLGRYGKMGDNQEIGEQKMLIRIHFRAIAKIIEDTTDEEVSIGVTNPKIDKRHFVSKLADYFEQDNPRFDRDKFMVACGLD